MKINNTDFSIPISRQFIQILETEIAKSGIDHTYGIIVNFRDPNYSAEGGGYHPVEIMISREKNIQYITDLAFVGSHYPELAKELDWDLSCHRFCHMGQDYVLGQGKSIFKIWQKNFCHYHLNGAFQVTVTPLG